MKIHNYVQVALLLNRATIATTLLLIIFTIMSCTKNKITNNTHGEEPVADSVYIKEGNRIAAFTFDTLRNSLLNAIHSQGFEDAITFCNEKAYPLTATYSDSVSIRRTALRYRNLNNKPDSLEFIVLNEMTEQLQNGNKPDSKIVRDAATNKIHFFKPILLQPLCLNCHGTPGTQIQSATSARIQQLYPDDQAVNFKEGDLRGIWHIIFKSRLTQ